MHGVSSERSRALRRWLRDVYDERCAYCRRRVGRDGTIDHYLPRALGGGNGRRNLRWACVPCNRAKADMHPDDWERMPRPQLPPEPEGRYARRVRLIAQAIRRAWPGRAEGCAMRPIPSTPFDPKTEHESD